VVAHASLESRLPIALDVVDAIEDDELSPILGDGLMGQAAAVWA
jgi:hypothetical protein